MAKHTQGPWQRSDYGQIVDQNGSDVLFRSVATMCSGSEDSITEAEANTDLIAAAPDLLHELQEVLEWALVEKAPLREQEIQSIRAAIDKAKGLTPQ